MKLTDVLNRIFGTLIVVGGLTIAYGAVSKNKDIYSLGAGSFVTGLAGVVINAEPRKDYHDDDTDYHDEN